jgi:2,3-bisphosphoglycerate-independent phosphoglycerate mutase
VGEDDPTRNPLATGEFPTLSLTHTLKPSSSVGPPAIAHGLDACLGVAGLPQSATGQTSILTGVNAPKVMGRHVSGFPGPTLRSVIEKHSILKRVREAGGTASFLNAFGPGFFQMPEASRRLSATSLATLSAGAPFRTWADLLEGRAVVHDLTHWRMRDRGYDLPLRLAEEAGAIVARESARQDFALFEYFETDRAGHDQDRDRAMRCLADLSRALETTLAGIDLDRHLVVVASDHGNLEDLATKTHTRNPAFFAAWGNVEGLADPECLTDLAPLILRAIARGPAGFAPSD